MFAETYLTVARSFLEKLGRQATRELSAARQVFPLAAEDLLQRRVKCLRQDGNYVGFSLRRWCFQP